jgi:hypothetical protein
LEDGYTLHLVARRTAEGQPSSGTSEENSQANGKSVYCRLGTYTINRDCTNIWIYFHDLLYILGAFHDVMYDLPCGGVIGS